MNKKINTFLKYCKLVKQFNVGYHAIPQIPVNIGCRCRCFFVCFIFIYNVHFLQSIIKSRLFFLPFDHPSSLGNTSSEQYGLRMLSEDRKTKG